LFPLDGSDFSDQIIDRALEIIGEPRPALHLARVLESPGWASHSFNAGLVGQYLDATREAIEADMRAAAGRLEARGYEVEWSMLEGNPGDKILEAARACNASMIAMATHGRGGLGRLLLGSVAQRVLNRATAPLLLIRPQGA
jgi:nucleotide-binding universal stress UspA family protein